MKLGRHLLVLLLALTMILSLSVTAFAVDEGSPDPAAPSGAPADLPKGTITIKDAVAREQYDIYQLLFLESYATTTNAAGKEVTHYAYKISDEAWREFFTTTGQTYFTIDDKGYVAGTNKLTESTASTVAKLALEYAKSDVNGKKAGEAGYTGARISPYATQTPPGEQKKDAEGNPVVDSGGKPVFDTSVPKTIVFNDLPLGYYLVDTSLGALCSLDTTDQDVEMEEKNEVPTNYKQVKEDSGPAEGGWEGSTTTVGENHADIGQRVEFRSRITVAPGTDNLIFHDKMASSFTMTDTDKQALRVTIKFESGEPKNLIRDQDYTVEFPGSHVSSDIDGNCSFHVKFQDSAFTRFNVPGKCTVTVWYSAILNETANVGVEGNINISRVTYGDFFHATPESKTVTRTFGFPVKKVDKETGEGLADTKFELHANNEGKVGDVIHLIQTKDGTKDATGAPLTTPTADEYRLAKSTGIDNATGKTTYETGAVTEITTNQSGQFTINGLDAGTYHLVETQAQAGYNKLEEPVVVNISYDPATKTVTIKKSDSNITSTGNVVLVENGSGSRLPKTGGIGTTIFYVLGGILAVGAVIVLVTRRRMSSEK